MIFHRCSEKCLPASCILEGIFLAWKKTHSSQAFFFSWIIFVPLLWIEKMSLGTRVIGVWTTRFPGSRVPGSPSFWCNTLSNPHTRRRSVRLYSSNSYNLLHEHTFIAYRQCIYFFPLQIRDDDYKENGFSIIDALRQWTQSTAQGPPTTSPAIAKSSRTFNRPWSKLLITNCDAG